MPLRQLEIPAIPFSVKDRSATSHHLEKPLYQSPIHLALTARVILEALLERHTKHDCHFERGFKGRRILVLFDRNHRLPCNADLIGEFLLGHLAEGPEFSYLISYCGHQSALR
jgi:hypothetical protein